jgi:transposase
LSPQAQDAIRKRVVHAVMEEKMKHAQAGRVFGLARGTVSRLVSMYRKGGEEGLRVLQRGRPPQGKLKGHQAATLVRLITDRHPEQLKLPFVLWTREAVRQLIFRRYSIRYSRTQVGRYLARWGFTPQKPIRRAYEKDDKAVETWLKKEYPLIRKKAQAERAEIHWMDEMGIRSDHQAGTSYGRRGQTPVIPCTGKRFGMNMISAITNRGGLSFRLFTGKFRDSLFIDFLDRLCRHRKRKIFGIVDRHPSHYRSAAVRKWLNCEDNRKRIVLFFLPTYSPELNPDELLNQDVKANAVGRKRAASIHELKFNVRSFLERRRTQPKVIESYFHHRNVIYAAR